MRTWAFIKVASTLIETVRIDVFIHYRMIKIGTHTETLTIKLALTEEV